MPNARRQGWECFLVVLPIVTGLFLPAWAGEQYAFLVAVKEYDPNQLNSLRFTENDVAGLAGALKKLGYEDQNVVLMTQTRGATQTRYLPTARNIRRELALLLGGVQKEDSILVCFSGHGVQFKEENDAYFCPADAQLEDRETLIGLGEIYAALKDCPATVRVLLVDACRNEPQSPRSKTVRRIELAPVGQPQAITPPNGVVALFSCSRGQQSFEDPKLSRGIFLHYVVEGLLGKADVDADRSITFEELTLYAKREVYNYARIELREPQMPASLGSSEGLLTLARFETLLPSLLLAPFAEAVAKIKQQEWAQSLKREVVETNSIGMKLALIPAGEFMMGSSTTETGRYSDETQHRVRITKPFYLGQYEVTQAEYQRVMGSNPSWFSPTGDNKDRVAGMTTDRFPVENVSWNDAVEFCNKLSQLDGLRPYYTLASIERDAGSIKSATVTLAGGNGYHLPTEAQWEYACRAGTTTPFHFGNAANGREANVNGDYPYGTQEKGPYLGRTTSVGNYAANRNRFGLYDMHGNVWEWCQDWYDLDYYAGSPTDDPTGPASGSYRVSRGGCWSNTAANCRSAYRNWLTPGSRSGYLGFRLALSPSGQ